MGDATVNAEHKPRKTDDVMIAQEVADYLRLDKATIYRLAQEGKIPAVKVGRTWRFKRELIDEWFKQESARISRSGEAAPEPAEP